MKSGAVAQTFDTAVALLFYYLETKETGKFKEAYTILHQNKQLLPFDISAMIGSQTLLQKAAQYDNEDAFNYLISLGYTDNKNADRSIYIDILLKKLNNFDLFYKWLQLFVKHKDKLVFDINAGHNTYHILPEILEIIPEKAQLVIDCGAGFEGGHCNMEKMFAALLKYDYVLSLELINKFYVAAANHNRIDVLRHLQERGVDVNFSLPHSRNALQDAVVNGNHEIVLYLLNHGAMATTAIRTAIECNKIEIIKSLLFYGGGLFQNLPATFNTLDIDLQGCFIVGMRVSGIPANPRMKGYARAIYSVAELNKVVAEQNRLELGMLAQQLPVCHLKAALDYLESQPGGVDNHLLRQENAAFDSKKLMPSLKFLCRLTIEANREQMVVMEGNAEIPFEAVVENLNDNIRNMLVPSNPDQKRALAILQGRLEELDMMQQRVTNILNHEVGKFEIIKCSSKWAFCTSIFLPISLGVYSGCTYMIACCSGPTGCNYVSSKAMLFSECQGLLSGR